MFLLSEFGGHHPYPVSQCLKKSREFKGGLLSRASQSMILKVVVLALETLNEKTNANRMLSILKRSLKL